MACVSQPKLQYYPFPEDIAPEARTQNLAQIEKGRKLYEINCAKCHSKKVNGQKIIPDFTVLQLDAYSIRIKNQAHVAVLPEDMVSLEELEDIQYFFSYKMPHKPDVAK